MTYCRAVAEITDEDLNTIAHMILEPWLLKEIVQRINETYETVNIPEDIYIAFPSDTENQ